MSLPCWTYFLRFFRHVKGTGKTGAGHGDAAEDRLKVGLAALLRDVLRNKLN